MHLGFLWYNKNMKHIVQGKVVLIDAEDEHIFQQYKWHISDSGYAVWRGNVNGKKETVRLHRLIARPPKGLVVDHINRDKLDNRKRNLRCVSQAVNVRNQERVENAKGYYLSKSEVSNCGKWVVDYRGICNTFDTEAEAKTAVKAIKDGTFVKKKDVIHEWCPRCGDRKQLYGGAWACRRCALQRMQNYYKRKKEKENDKNEKGGGRSCRGRSKVA